jgi:hypothetical protein
LEGTSGKTNLKYASSNPLIFGREFDDNGYDFSFIGNIDDIRIYNRVLNEAEIQSLNNE